MKVKKLWQTGKNQLDPIIEAFETGDDLLLDQKLVKYDVLGSLVHAKGLVNIGILSQKEFQQVEKGLKEITSQGLTLEAGDEDVHTKIENYLTENYGEVGKKIHTGRSRNDQVLTAIRLFAKSELLEIWESLLVLTESFLKFSKQYEFVSMPGYTHMQKAMPSSVGMWSCAFAESLFDDLVQLKAVYSLNNQSPLGSGAGYGVPLELNRGLTARLMGFEKVQNNSLYAQNSRGKIEAAVVSSLVSILSTINKFASDIMLFTTAEFNYFSVSESATSGSSIMPQKKNVDVAELLRSKVHGALANYVHLVGLSSNLPSGYNRDLQDSKKPLFNSLKITKDSLKTSRILLDSMTPNKEVLEKAMTPEIFAAHNAFGLVKNGVSFREAYHSVKTREFTFEPQNYTKIIQQSSHAGGTGNLGLKKLFKKLEVEQKIMSKEIKQWREVSKI